MKNIKVANQYFKEKYNIDEFFSVKQSSSLSDNASYIVSSPYNSIYYRKYEFQIANFIEIGETYIQTKKINLKYLDVFQTLCPSMIVSFPYDNKNTCVFVRVFDISFFLNYLSSNFKYDFYSHLADSLMNDDLLLMSAEAFAKQMQRNPEYQNLWKYAIKYDFQKLHEILKTDYISDNIFKEWRLKSVKRFFSSLSDETKKLYFATETLYDLKPAG